MFDVNEVRKDFPMIQNNKDLIYFDSGATSFKPKCVIDAVMDYYTLYNSNIHRGDYDISVKVSKEYDDTRKTIARFIGADDPRCIVFTSGSTSALNLVAYNFGNGFLKQGDLKNMERKQQHHDPCRDPLKQGSHILFFISDRF